MYPGVPGGYDQIFNERMQGCQAELLMRYTVMNGSGGLLTCGYDSDIQ